MVESKKYFSEFLCFDRQSLVAGRGRMHGPEHRGDMTMQSGTVKHSNHADISFCTKSSTKMSI